MRRRATAPRASHPSGVEPYPPPGAQEIVTIASPAKAPPKVEIDRDVLLVLVAGARGEQPAGLSAAIGAALAELVRTSR